MNSFTLIRRETLVQVCKDRGFVQDNDKKKPSPGKLATAIDKKINQCSDLLNGRAPFGEEIARHIEERLGLGQWFLDGGAGWPFPQLDRREFDALAPWQQMEIQGKVREMVANFQNKSPQLVPVVGSGIIRETPRQPNRQMGLPGTKTSPARKKSG